MPYLALSILLLILGVVLNLTAEAATLNCLWVAYVVLAHLTPKNRNSNSISKPRSTYKGRALT